MKHAIAYIDGSGNSERIQACATVLDISGVEYSDTQILAPHTTNNVGEYSGLLLCLRYAKQLGVESLQIHSDSRLIVEQVLGNWKCKEADLRRLREKVYESAKGFRSLTISWIPREENTKADGLCRAAIKEALAKHQKSTAKRPHPPIRIEAS